MRYVSDFSLIFVLLGCGKLHSDRVVPAGLAAIYCLSFCEEKEGSCD